LAQVCAALERQEEDSARDFMYMFLPSMFAEPAVFDSSCSDTTQDFDEYIYDLFPRRSSVDSNERSKEEAKEFLKKEKQFREEQELLIESLTEEDAIDRAREAYKTAEENRLNMFLASRVTASRKAIGESSARGEIQSIMEKQDDQHS
jgi:hypothetical protein